MKTKIKWVGIIILVAIVIGGATAFYMFNAPHRDVQSSSTDFTLNSTDLVNEYLKDADAANAKYLQEEGESKIIEVSGTIASIDKDLNNQTVVLLKDANQQAGVSCTFTQETNAHVANLKIGDQVTLKGVIRSGAGYDEDLELYEDVILEKCDIVSQN